MGTFDSTAFRSYDKADGTHNVLFNGPGDGEQHGHVVSHEEGGETVYDYVRDVEGNTYDVGK
jgi:hypothetical protein